MLFGLSALVYLAHGSMDKAVLMALFGVLLASVGLDPVSGQPRFTFGILVLRDGVGLTPVVIGLFGVSEVLLNLRAQAGEVFQKPSRTCCRRVRTGKIPQCRLRAEPFSAF